MKAIGLFALLTPEQRKAALEWDGPIDIGRPFQKAVDLNDLSELSRITRELADGQEPLGAEFEAVWDSNVERLYQS